MPTVTLNYLRGDAQFKAKELSDLLFVVEPDAPEGGRTVINKAEAMDAANELRETVQLIINEIERLPDPDEPDLT